MADSNINYRPNDEFKKVLVSSVNVSKSKGVSFVAEEIILLAILRSDGRTAQLLKKYGVTEEVYVQALNKNFNRNQREEGYTAKVKHLLNKSVEIADKTGCPYVGVEHFLFALLDFNCMACVMIKSLCEDVFSMRRELNQYVSQMGSSSRARENRANPAAAPAAKAGVSTDKPSKTPTPEPEEDEEKDAYAPPINVSSIEGTVLEKFGIDLTDKARKGKLDPVIGREKETEMIINALNRRNKNSPLLIGEPGTGKTAVVEGLAQRIVSGAVPASLKNKILFSLDLGGVIAGAKYKGELEGRFKEMLKFVEDSGNIIIFIDEIHNLVEGAKSDGMDASEIMKPALARGEIQVIGATTIDEYRQFIEKDKALERRFSVIHVEPPSIEDSIKIITGLKDAFEAHHCVTISQEAIVAAVKLSQRYITDRFLPDKAVDLIDEAAARARLSVEAIDKEIPLKEEEARRIDNEIDYARSCGKDYSYLEQRLVEINAEIDKLHEKQYRLQSRKNAYIDADDIARVVADMTDIPVARLNETERQRFLNLENVLHRRVIGQNGAVRCVSQAVRRAMSGINNPKKPNGVFLFVGPTGVGKTELAKALAEALFADENTLIRIDMGEYMDKASITRLIGAPPGYVGYEEEGQLTEKVRRKPYSVVLFDEIEKAHPDVFNLMLQIFDDGRLTDSKGRLIDFKNTVIILTSNEGAAEIEKFRKAGKISAAETEEAYDRALRRKFKPEFLNRIDQIVYFENLSKNDSGRICSLIIDDLAKRLAEMKVYFSYDEAVVDLIVARGYSDDYGARPLRRAVCSSIEDEIAERLISGEITEGCHVYASAENGEINFIIE